MSASEFRHVGTRYRLAVSPRRSAWARAVSSGRASDPLVRGWFNLAAKSEAGRLVDVSGWPVLSTRDAFTLARVWARTLIGLREALRDAGEPIASLAVNWYDDARHALIGGPHDRPPPPRGVCFESVQLWSLGAGQALGLAAELRGGRLQPAAPTIRAAALEGLEVLGIHLWRSS